MKSKLQIRWRKAEREAAALATPVRPLGEPGPRFDRRSLFFIGLSAAAGVAVTYAVIEVLLAARGMLILIVVALFLAVGIEPMIVWLERRHFRRWIAVTVVLLGIAVMLALFLVAAITPLVEQGRQFASHAPELLTHIRDRYPIVSDLDEKYHLEEHLTTQLDGSGSALATGLLGAGRGGVQRSRRRWNRCCTDDVLLDRLPTNPHESVSAGATFAAATSNRHR